VVALCVALLAGASSVQAQTLKWEDRGYIGINLGVQPQSQTFTETSTPVINGEIASIAVPHTISRSAIIDGSVGVRVVKNFGIGVGYWNLKNTETATLSAQIPNPIVFNSPRTASASTGELTHRESTVSVQLLWMLPVSAKFDVAAIVGPAFISVAQDLVRGITTTEGAPLFGTVAISSVQTQKQSKIATALMVGTDLTYRFTRQVGAGGFVRFNRLSNGTIDLPAAGGDGVVSVSAGGFQLGAGLRVRF
jgi:hypothetical protein